MGTNMSVPNIRLISAQMKRKNELKRKILLELRHQLQHFGMPCRASEAEILISKAS